MSDERGRWSRARRARQKREDDAPRRAAIRTAFDAANSHKGETADEVRSALVEALAARGIRDVRTAELDYLVEAITTSPRRAARRLIFKQAKAVVGVVSELRAMAQPRWTETPAGIPSLLSWRDDQEEVEVVLDAADLQSAHDVVVRLFTDLPQTAADPADEDDDGRPCGCWLSCDPASDSSGVVNVHIGKHSIAHIDGQHADLARELVTKRGGQRQAVEIIAELHGEDADTAQIKLFLPDRP